MLSRSTTHPDTSKYDPVNFTVSLMYAALFIIIFDITECRLIRQRTDRSCLKGLSLPEDNFGVFMCLTLVLSGKVQVDIRLFISLKSRNVSNGISNPSLESGFPQRGQSLSGISHPLRPEKDFTRSESKSLYWQCLHR